MLRRRQPVGHRGPGLARTVARTAMISGTAAAVSGSVASRQAQLQQASAQEASDARSVGELQQQVEQLQAQTLQSQMAPADSGVQGDDLVTQLARLGELHQQGVLTTAEFEAAKARLISG